jgi:Fe-Mn family superoxide dismutase
MLLAKAQFIQKPLPYAFNALEPYIDIETMQIHYSKHHAGYVAKLNQEMKALGMENQKDLDAILKNITQYNTTIRNNAGGHYNHQLFWILLTPQKNLAPSPALLKAIEKEFKSMETFKAAFINEGSARFGSGWIWMIVDKDKKLRIVSTPNQDNPLMNDSPVKGFPILGIDVWEHAYYLKYQNKRGDYLNAIWNVINWDKVSERYLHAIQ